LSQLSQTTTKDFGPTPDRITVTMKTVVDSEGIAITTTAGGGYNSLLSRTFTHDQVEAARVFYAHIRDCAQAGKGVWQIEAEIAALIEMEQAVDVEQVADAINAEVDAHQVRVVATHDAVVETVAEVMAGTAQTGGWYGARKAAQQTAAPASEPMARILAQAERDGGRIVRCREATSTQLVALSRRGLVQLVYGRRGNQRVITGATLIRNLSEVAA
jgi:hypothetical protein